MDELLQHAEQEDRENEELAAATRESIQAVESERQRQLQEDEELKLALEMSMQDAGPNNPIELVSNIAPTVVAEQQEDDVKAEPSSSPSPPLSGLAAIRKEQEKSRLDRLKRLGYSVDDELSWHSHKRQKVDHAIKSEEKKEIPKATPSVRSPALKYAHGQILMTFVEGHGGLRFPELFDKSHLKVAVLSSWQVDIDFCRRPIPSSAQFFLIRGWDSATEKEGTYGNEADPNMFVVHPPMLEIIGDQRSGVMHSKLMLLFHHTYVRVVIPTGNLVEYDWRMIQNLAFVQDFPVSSDKADLKSSPFAKEIVRFLSAQGMPAFLIDRFRQHDFSMARARVVCSQPGNYAGEDVDLWGFGSLARAIASTNSGSTSKWQVEVQTGSLGAAYPAWLQYFGKALRGLRTKDWWHERSTKIDRKDLKMDLEIGFPSDTTVKTSKYGPAAAGTICFNPQYWNNSHFPKDWMRDVQCRRKGILMHSKVIIARSQASGTQQPGWVYMGSHNFTSSAWGSYTSDKRTKEPKIKIMNWEIGILLPMPKDVDVADTNEWYEKQGFDVPFIRPMKKMTDEPWFFR